MDHTRIYNRRVARTEAESVCEECFIKNSPLHCGFQRGMSQRDIEDTLREIYGSEISQGLISRITDKILPEVN